MTCCMLRLKSYRVQNSHVALPVLCIYKVQELHTLKAQNVKLMEGPQRKGDVVISCSQDLLGFCRIH